MIGDATFFDIYWGSLASMAPAVASAVASSSSVMESSKVCNSSIPGREKNR